jgi:hypothetical protein
VAAIDNPRRWELDYEQLYAQLRDEFYNGFAYWFDTAEEERMKKQNAYFRVVSDEEQLIAQRFRRPRRNELAKHYSAATIAQLISYGRQAITSRRVSLVMKSLGFKSERNSQGCYYRLVEMNDNESQQAIADMLSEQPQQQDLPF